MQTFSRMVRGNAARGCGLGITLALFVVCAGGCASSSGSPTKTSGAIVTWMGDGTQGFDGDGHDRAHTWLNQPTDLTFGPDGRAYIVDWNNHRIRRLEDAGTVATIIGRSLPGDWNCENPTDPANCAVPMDSPVYGPDLALNHPMALKFGKDGYVYLAAWHNHKVEAFEPSSLMVHIVAGGQAPGYAGDGGPAAAAKLNFVDSIAIGRVGEIYVGDERNRRVRRMQYGAAANGGFVITDVAGTSPAPASSGYAGDGGPATMARLALAPYTVVDGADNPPPGGGIAAAPNGDLYISDTFNHCIRRVEKAAGNDVGDSDPSLEIITTIAGTCTTSGFSGDGGPAASALLNQPEDLELSGDGKLLYVADTGNHVVRRIDLTTGTIERVAGNGTPGFSGDYGPATLAQLKSPYGLAFDQNGTLYIADTLNNVIRMINP